MGRRAAWGTPAVTSRGGTDAAVRRTSLAALVGLVATVLVVVLPDVRLAYRSPAGHLVLETVVAMTGGLVAVLFYGRFRRSHTLHDLLLVHALTVLAVAAMFFVALPLVVGVDRSNPLVTWAPLLVRLAGAVLLLAGALAPTRRLLTGARPARESLVGVALLVGVAVGVQLLGAFLPDAVTTLPPPEASAYPLIEGHPFVLAVQVVSFLCYAAAAGAFTLRARNRGDELLGWVGAACALGASARLNYLLFPSLYSSWLYTGDFLRLGFYLLLLVGALREVRAYWNAQAEAAVNAERHRLARELHDGAVQELGYIRQLAGRGTVDAAAAAQIRAAAERAVDEARSAIAALTAPAGEPVAATVARAVREMGERYDVPVRFVDRLGPAALAPERREALVRIGREAVSNAARHGQPSAVSVTLGPDRLVVEDDGTGFDPAGVPPGHFGLTSMRDRAEGMGAALDVRSRSGEGTTVTVTWDGRR